MFEQSEDFILLDTEYTSWEGCIDTGWDNDAGQYKELVQIAAIKVDPTTLTVRSTFNQFIQPQINPTLSEYFRNLTNISQSTIDDADQFETVFEAFQNWAGQAQRYSYGYDVDIITRNIELYDEDTTIDHEKYTDIRPLFEDVGVPTDEYTSGTVVEHFGESPEAQHHNALNDCQNMLRAIELS